VTERTEAVSSQFGVTGTPVVSVVIPTVGRPELSRAVATARAQRGTLAIEIIVVVDASEGSVDLPAAVRESADTILWTGGGRRGSFARNLGVEAASGEWIAFLDDDDAFTVDKLETQLALAMARPNPASVVVSCRHIQVDSQSGRRSSPIPARLISTGEPVADYLFRRRRPAGGRASMYTSGLFCSRSLARRVQWNSSLRRHQDWDWLVRAGAEPDVEFVQAPEALVEIQLGSVNSISAGASWTDSLTWANSVDGLLSRPVYADFVTAQTLRYAVAARSASGIAACLRALVANRRLPAIGPVLIALGGLLPRTLIQRLMTMIR